MTFLWAGRNEHFLSFPNEGGGGGGSSCSCQYTSAVKKRSRFNPLSIIIFFLALTMASHPTHSLKEEAFVNLALEREKGIIHGTRC